MVWSKVCDKMHSQSKHLEAGVADALWVRALSWCGDHETDGVIRKAAATAMAVVVAADPLCSGTADELIERLVRIGLWEQLPGGDYRVHNFLDYNPSREQLQAKRAKVAARVARHAERKRKANAVSPPVTNTAPDPDPEGDPSDPLLLPYPSDPEGVGPMSAFATYVLSQWPQAKGVVAFERRSLEAFPGVDLLAEAKKARAWQKCDLKRRQRPRALVFLHNWFASAQERMGRGGSRPTQGQTIPVEYDSGRSLEQKLARLKGDPT